MKEFNQILTRLTGIVLLLFLLTGSVFNQVPDKFNYQAVLRDAQGVARTNYAANVQVSIVQGSASGSVVYSETHSATSNALGLINLEIGSVNPANFANIDWSNGPYFIKINVNGTEMGTTQLLSVPYALYAKTAESANNAGVSGNESAFNNWDKDFSDDFSGNYNDLSDKPTIPAPVAGTESVFNAWDKNASDDFLGNYNDLINKPWLNASGIVYSNSNIGIGTASPTQQLSVAGNISATGSVNSNSYTYNVAKTRYLNIGGSTGSFNKNYTDIPATTTAFAHYLSSSATTYKLLYNVDLPNGAVIKGIRMTVYSSTGTITCSLNYGTDGWTKAPIASLTSATHTNTWQWSPEVTCDHTVNTANYCYGIEVSCDTPGLNLIGIIRIRYEISNL